MDKRGISPVIASVLLILLVLVLASLIFLWARGFISEQIEKFGQPVEDACASIDFEVEAFVDPGKTLGIVLEVVNNGDVDIHSLNIRKFLAGDSEVTDFNFGVDAGSSASGEINLRMKNNAEPSEIIVYPVIIGKVKGRKINKPFTCSEMGKTIQMP